jgi:phosphoglycerate dehydrogenase-like enzyme
VKIVVPDDYPPFYSASGQAELDRLTARGEVTVYDTRFRDPKELQQRIAPAEVLINVRAYSRFDVATLGVAPGLKCITVVGTGVDNIDVAECTRRGIVVCNTPGVATISVAELAIGLMLSVARMIPASDRALRAGEWRHWEGPELAGKTLALLGLGAIGRQVAVIGRGLGMRVIGWTFHPDPIRATAASVELVGFEQLFRQADVLSIHLRLSPHSTALVGAHELALLKPGAILINTARAAIVDQGALLAALRSGGLGGAGLDVHDPEPLPADKNPFLELENVVLTPHSGTVTREANQRSLREPVENVLAFLDGRPRNVVNPA